MKKQQAKQVIENFIKREVRKSLTEESNYDDLYADIQDEMKKIYTWTKVRMESNLNEDIVNSYVETIRRRLDRIERIQSDIR